MLKWNKIEQMFVNLQEERKMSETTIELIKLILQQENIDEAIIKTNEILTAFRTLREPSQEASSLTLRDNSQPRSI
jgi:hypothetical protein